MATNTSAPAPAKRRAKFAIGGGVICLALVGMIGWALGRPGSTHFYMTVSEVRSGGTTAAAEEVRVNGKLVQGTDETNGLTTTFAITDGRSELDVTTDKPLPDAFYAAADRIDIVAQGHYDGRRFVATSVFAKCPSKFKAKT